MVGSANRVSLLARYLVALGQDTRDTDTDTGTDTETKTKIKTSVKRKRLHMLYLLNDLFHHTKYHLSSGDAFSTLSASLQPHLAELLSYAAAYDREKHPKHHRRLSEVLDIWQENGYFESEYFDKLRDVVASAAVSGPVQVSTSADAESTQPERKPRDGPYVMPPIHGDPATPYYDLPAGNMVPHIIPNSTVPLRPEMMKPLQFMAGPADEKLVQAMKVFFTDVDRIYEPGALESSDGIVDIDELGQPVVRDEITGDILEGETYYGWSRSFCQQMKKRNVPSQSRSRSGSRSRSPPRRYSSASDDSRYRSRSRTRSRSPSPSRSRQKRYTPSPSRSRSRSYSPAPAQPQHAYTYPQQQHHHRQQGYPPQPPQMPFPGNPFPPPSNYQNSWPLPHYPNFPPPQMQMPAPGSGPGPGPGPPGLSAPPMPMPMPMPMPPGPGMYNYPSPGQGWNSQPPPPPPMPPSGRGWR